MLSLKGLETVGIGWATAAGWQGWEKPFLAQPHGAHTTVRGLACSLQGHHSPWALRHCAAQLDTPTTNTLSSPGQTHPLLSVLLWEVPILSLFSPWTSWPLIASLFPGQKRSLTLCIVLHSCCPHVTTMHIPGCFREIPPQNAGISLAGILLAIPHSESVSLPLL